ncbi:MAG TPA: DUF4080 domain-containing protein [Tepidisphaeraceae bacterium]|jgi:radical SAM superfamily enzyme YgiQ (UPF0313 family)
MPDILLTTLNAKYIHAAFGLRYLLANLGELQPRAKILEFDINQRPIDILEAILAANPKIVGIGVYIWNITQSTQLVADLKRLRPDITIILGGPEVSYESDGQPIVQTADYIITGEADLAFAQLCRALLSGEQPEHKIIPAPLPDFSYPKSKTIEGRPTPKSLLLPYHLYTEQDAKHRVIYVEASRGCPFQCEFCLSSLDIPVRNVPLEDFLAAMQSLLDRGVRQFKFVDRTFNLNLAIGQAILQFFHKRWTPGLFLHFEMIPDRLPAGLREWIQKFPPGGLQFEVGIQTFNDDVARRISRRQDNSRVAENFRFLREQTGVHIHADLIVGLPGEDVDSFAAGFDRLVALRPQEIQVGILKRLRGTAIVRHDAEWGMVYSPSPPYEILQTNQIDFSTMQRLRRFARYWDLVSNSGNFIETIPLLWKDGSPFHAFLNFSDWLHARSGGRTHGIALDKLAELLFNHLVELGQSSELVAQSLAQDWLRPGRRDLPEFLRPHVPQTLPRNRAGSVSAPPRQSRHLASP